MPYGEVQEMMRKLTRAFWERRKKVVLVHLGWVNRFIRWRNYLRKDLFISSASKVRPFFIYF